MADIPIVDGHRYTLTLRGSRSEHVITSDVVVLASGELELAHPETGKSLRVPRSAVVTAKRVSEEDARAVLGSNQADGGHRDSKGSDTVAMRSGEVPAARPYATLARAREGISSAVLRDIADRFETDPALQSSHSEYLAAACRAVAAFNSSTTYEEKKVTRAAALESTRLPGSPLDVADEAACPQGVASSLVGLNTLVETSWERYVAEEMDVVVDIEGLPPSQTYFVQGRKLIVHLTVAVPQGRPEVEMVQLRIAPSTLFRVIRPDAIASVSDGNPAEVKAEVRVSDLGMELGEVPLELSLSYRRIDGGQGRTPVTSHIARVTDSASAPKLANPYASYSGGTPVEDPRMFFGRAELLTDIGRQLTEGPLGQCFVLYGQKRSGKSSVLSQLRQNLGDRVIAIEVTLGAIDPGSAEKSFIELCVDEFRRLVEHELGAPGALQWWPTDEKIAREPIQSFKRALRAATQLIKQRNLDHGIKLLKYKPVLLVDEFTYIHEYIREGKVSSSFMRQWKALLQTGEFSAVVAGQDSMPDFIDEYPNEFAVTTTRRLSYLSNAEARQLADEPIHTRGGESRYRGGSLDYLISLSGGSPYYLQILCDRLVRSMNEQRIQYVTKSLVDVVVDDLIHGTDRLRIDKFDPLVTAAGESVARHEKPVYLDFLRRLAQATEAGPAEQRDVVMDSLDAEVLEDLRSRGVVETDPKGRCSLRVELFAKWLRSQ